MNRNGRSLRSPCRSTEVPRCVLLFIAIACLAACSRASDSSMRGGGEAGVVIDTEVMAYLSMARALHHEANLEEETDVPSAIHALEQLVQARRPHPRQSVPEVEEVLADTLARIAELETRRGDVARAAESVREGLTHAPAPSYFRGHLLEVGGVAEEDRANELRDAGKAAESAAARRHAMDLLREAVLVQERVVRESLADAGRPGSGS